MWPPHLSNVILLQGSVYSFESITIKGQQFFISKMIGGGGSSKVSTVHLRFCSVMTPYWLSLHCPLIHELWVICRCIKSWITKGSFMPLSMWTWRRQTPRQWRATRMRLSTSTSSSNTATRSSSCTTSEFVVIVVFCFQHVSRLLSWYYVLKVQSGISMQYSYLFLGVKFSEIL